MSPRSNAISELWAATTEYESVRVKAIVAVSSVVLGLVATPGLAVVWERAFEPSPAVISIGRVVAMFVAWVCLSYVENRTSVLA